MYFWSFVIIDPILASAHPDQSLYCPHEESLHSWPSKMLQGKILILRRLIRIFTGCTCPKVYFMTSRLECLHLFLIKDPVCNFSWKEGSKLLLLYKHQKCIKNGLDLIHLFAHSGTSTCAHMSGNTLATEKPQQDLDLVTVIGWCSLYYSLCIFSRRRIIAILSNIIQRKIFTWNISLFSGKNNKMFQILTSALSVHKNPNWWLTSYSGHCILGLVQLPMPSLTQSETLNTV